MTFVNIITYKNVNEDGKLKQLGFLINFELQTVVQNIHTKLKQDLNLQILLTWILKRHKAKAQCDTFITIYLQKS